MNTTNVNNTVGELIVPTEIFLTGKKSLGRDIYIINGITFQDTSDQDADTVRVDIEVVNQSGTIALNDEYLPLADFESCSVRTYSGWTCHGDGRGRIMTFVAESRNIDHILKDMTFTPYFFGEQDEIMVSIYEGEGGDCLDGAEHSGATIYQGCTHHVEYVSIPLPKDTKVIPAGTRKSVLSQWEFDNICETIFTAFGKSYLLLGLAIGGIVLFLVLAVVLYCKCTSSRNRKSNKKSAPSRPGQTENESSRI
jgi:hypothetical protein